MIYIKELNNTFALDGYYENCKMMLKLAHVESSICDATNLSIYNENCWWRVEDKVFTFDSKEPFLIEIGGATVEFDVIDRLSTNNPFNPSIYQ